MENYQYPFEKLMSYVEARRFVILAIVTACIGTAFLSACSNSNSGASSDSEEIPDHPGPPDITVFIVPLDGVSPSAAEKLRNEFATNFADGQWEPYTVETLPHSDVPDSCFNARHTRYSAKKVMAFLQDKYGNKAEEIANNNRTQKYWCYYIIGVTNKDIATAIHGSDDYGILGLSYIGHPKIHNSIISTYRLPRKKDLWKLAVHEFCHGFYSLPHCPDEHCIMHDAKGGNPHFETKDSLCLHCACLALYGD